MSNPRHPGPAGGNAPRPSGPTSADPDNRDGTVTTAPCPTGPSLLVVGDLVTDVLVVTAGALQIGSDATGSIGFTGGGQAANTAAWLAHSHGTSGGISPTPRSP